MILISGTIPVGIVSARQRLDAEKSRIPTPATENHRPEVRTPVGSDAGAGAMPLPPSGPLVTGIGLPGDMLNSKECLKVNNFSKENIQLW